MKEQGLYVGERTLTAELARQRRLHEGLKPGGPAGRYLATMLGAILGRKAPGLPPQHGEVVAHARALLRWKGFDPERHTLSRSRGQFPGLVVRDHLGRARLGLRDHQLKAMGDDESFLVLYAEELQAKGLL